MSQVTLTEVLQKCSILKHRGITFIEQSGQEDFLSYQELYQLALNGLGFLQQNGLKPNDELVFQVEDNRTFLMLFWSCVLGGIIPVPLSIGKNDDQKAKLFNVWQVLKSPYLACSLVHLEKIAGYGLSSSQDHLYARIRAKSMSLDEFLAHSSSGTVYSSRPADLAFIQFSSGSTGSPKGVMLTHENLITNVSAIAGAAGYTTDDSTLSWMPLTHDMGLIGFHINPLFSHMNQYLMPTGVFVRNPILWLSKTGEHRITVICSPNFGYKYLLKYLDKSKNYGWDLSPVRIVYNGAEPISEDLGSTFLDALARYGLQRKAMCPVYGLAEASLAVSMSDLNAEIISVSLDRKHLNVGSSVRPTDPENALSFVNVGQAIQDVFIEITNDSGKAVADETVGHVKIRGKNVTAGYYNNPEATAKAIDKDWLDTGDLGFMKDGSLYITGRAKDIFFVNGQNFYPHDFERIAEEVDGVDLNKVIISGASGTDADSEEVIAFLFHRGDLASFVPLIKSLKAHINTQTGVDLTKVIPVRDIPKTTSGKLQRFKLIEKYRSGDYNQVMQEMAMAQNADGDRAKHMARPENETEHLLLEIWQELLNREDIRVTDGFFEVGGNSLKAAELAMIVRKRFEVELPMADPYEYQSIRAMAELISSLKNRPYQSIAAISGTESHPVSRFQRRLFYFQETRENSTAYNVPVAFRITHEPDIDKLKRCFAELIQRHDVFRASFKREGPEVLMSVHQNVDVEMVVMRHGFNESETILSLIRPFDLSEPGLIRGCVLQNDTGEFVLFFDFHHIIMDGVSVYLFIEELIKLYLGESLEEPSAQYLDFTHWSLIHQSKGTFQANKEYWLTKLGGELPRLEMPSDRARPQEFDHSGSKTNFGIGKVKSARLREMSSKYGCSMHVLLFTVYQVLLHKYTGQRDLVIGIPVSSRNHPDITRTMGMFVNNLAVRARVEPAESFEKLLQRLKSVVNSALAHDYPFDILLGDLEIKGDPGRNPLFDTMFLYQNMSLPFSDAHLGLKPMPIDPGTSRFDLSLEVFDNGLDPLTFGFEYATALFDADTIQRLTNHFNALLDRVLSNPLSKIADIPLLTVEEYQHQVFDFNNTGKVYPEQSVLDLIQNQATSFPDRPAIFCQDQEMSFSELINQSASLAMSLRSKGLKRGEIVAVYMNRSPELIVSILGILKAGGMYLPIDTDLPGKRVQYLLSHSRCGWSITKEEYRSRLITQTAPDLKLLIVDQLISGDIEEGIELVTDCGEFAYLLYTSGTTGNPKGVIVTHQSLHNYVSWAVSTYVRNDNGVFPLFTSISFDLTVTSIFTPLASGHSIVVYDDADNEHMVIKALKDHRVDIMKLTPSHLRLIKNIDLTDLEKVSVQKMIVGGESFDADLASEIYQKFEGKLLLFNEYGPTESTVGCMIHEFDPKYLSQTVPIGVPVANTKIYLLDERLHPVPQGVRGEIYIGGAGLAAGYLFDEALTNEKFIPNPFIEGEKIYRTGDLAQRRADGLLEYLVRVDEQIKINGYRIEPGEISHQLCNYPGITDCVVIPINLNGREYLSAYYLTEQDTVPLQVARLKTYLAEHLPFYMIPEQIMALDAFPITGNGKIDYRTLATYRVEKGNESLRTPQNETEEAIARIWEDLLGIAKVAPSDNFFELGGDSIKAVQIVARLHEKGISTRVKDILTYHTIEQLILSGKLAYRQSLADQGIVSGQKALIPIESWFFSQHFANPSYYNQSALLSINKVLDIARLQNAFEALVNHHDGLRLNYDMRKESLFFNEQHLNRKFSIPIIEQGEDLMAQLAGIKSVFDLNRSLLIKAVVFSRQYKQQYLFVTAHHLVTDGISWRILLDDLARVYESLVAGRELILPPKTQSLMEWGNQLENWRAKNQKISDQYWEEVKQTKFTLPLDFETRDWSAAGKREHRVCLDKDQTYFLIKEAHSAYRTDVFTLLNVSLVWTLHQWTGDKTFVVEHENHGRYLDDCDVTRTLGWFTTMYPVKLELVGESPKDQVKAIKEQIKSVPDHGMSFGLGTQRSENERSGPHSEVRLNYLGEFTLEKDEYWSFSGLTTGLETDPENHLTTRLELNAMVMNEELFIDIAYHQSAFSENTIRSFGSEFIGNLRRLLNFIRTDGDVHFTPSDFKTHLDQKELDELFS